MVSQECGVVLVRVEWDRKLGNNVASVAGGLGRTEDTGRL